MHSKKSCVAQEKLYTEAAQGQGGGERYAQGSAGPPPPTGRIGRKLGVMGEKMLVSPTDCCRDSSGEKMLCV